MAASAGPVPPIRGCAPRLEPLVRVRITPEPWRAICRAAARAVRKLVRSPVTTGRQEVLGGHLDQGSALDVAARDEVERHVDAAGGRHHAVGMTLDRLLVQRVDDGDLRVGAERGHLIGDPFQRLARAPGQEQPRSLAGEFDGDA